MPHGSRNGLSQMTSTQPARPPLGATGLMSNATLLLTLTTVFWGGNAVAGKFAIGHVSPMVLTTLRWVLASLILLVLARDHLRQDWPVIRERLPYLFLCGAFGFTAFNAMLYSAVKYTSAINVTILQAAMPMFIFAMNFVVFRTSVHWAQILGYGVTLFGVAVVASGGDLAVLAEFALNFGDLIMLVAVLIYGAYSVALRSRPDIHWLSFLATLAIAALLTSFGTLAFEVASGEDVWPVTTTGWAVVLYTVIFPSLLSQAFFARGVELIGSNRAGLFVNLVPVFGSLFAVVLLGEDFRWFHAAALLLVMGGIGIAQHLSSTR